MDIDAIDGLSKETQFMKAGGRLRMPWWLVVGRAVGMPGRTLNLTLASIAFLLGLTGLLFALSSGTFLSSLVFWSVVSGVILTLLGLVGSASWRRKVEAHSLDALMNRTAEAEDEVWELDRKLSEMVHGHHPDHTNPAILRDTTDIEAALLKVANGQDAGKGHVSQPVKRSRAKNNDGKIWFFFFLTSAIWSISFFLGLLNEHESIELGPPSLFMVVAVLGLIGNVIVAIIGHIEETKRANRPPTQMELVEVKDAAMSYAQSKQVRLFRTVACAIDVVRANPDISETDAAYQSFLKQIRVEAMGFNKFKCDNFRRISVPVRVWTEPTDGDDPLLAEQLVIWVNIVKNYGGYEGSGMLLGRRKALETA